MRDVEPKGTVQVLWLLVVCDLLLVVPAVALVMLAVVAWLWFRPRHARLERAAVSAGETVALFVPLAVVATGWVGVAIGTGRTPALLEIAIASALLVGWHAVVLRHVGARTASDRTVHVQASD